MLTIEERPATARVASTNRIPEGCWVYDADWSKWPSACYPCNPNEWPFNLEASKGTRTFHEIIGWFLKQHPQVYPPDVDQLLSLVEQCAVDKTITAQVDMDPDAGTYQLRISMYGCPRANGRLVAAELYRLWELEKAHPALAALAGLISVEDEAGSFPPVRDEEVEHDAQTP
ncbi:hypothetical protein [Mitsuaria sp. GD03876]|uniref:hypothetical protein n=1 Tax=Mitsuaria sp. GD03876 TaxID=2975399 RepID=UPI00244B5A1F|nr:hypothetical protein [Mitsuaria sp. GD03876]MDH0868397.1 hypothetical protein [Mitsuaria sp. GD03876]